MADRAAGAASRYAWGMLAPLAVLATIACTAPAATPVSAPIPATACVPGDVVLTYEVEGMKCDGCSSAIVAKVKKVDGVIDCTVDRATKLATITVKDEAIRPKVEAAITKLGYTITKKS